MRLRVPLAVTGALALVVAGTAAPASAAAAQKVAVTITKSHRLHLQTQLTAGLVEFTLTGAKGENFQLAKAKGSAGPAELVADGNALNKSGKATAIERDFTALGGAEVGHAFWMVLGPGTYYAIDTNAEKATTADVATLTVSGDATGAALPDANATITAVHEMDWAKTAHLPASGRLKFDNPSSEYHFVDLIRAKNSHMTLAQLRYALKHNQQSKFDLKNEFDTGVLSPGLSQVSGYHLKPGTYALLCWWPDEHGVPHALMGMSAIVHVG